MDLVNLIEIEIQHRDWTLGEDAVFGTEAVQAGWGRRSPGLSNRPRLPVKQSGPSTASVGDSERLGGCQLWQHDVLGILLVLG